jgi:hypothetical protein
MQDVTIACAHVQLALEAVGVQSRWIGAFKKESAGPVLGLKGANIAGFLTFGRRRRANCRPAGRNVHDGHVVDVTSVSLEKEINEANPDSKEGNPSKN